MSSPFFPCSLNVDKHGCWEVRFYNTTTCVTLTESLLFCQELGFFFFMFKVSGWIK